MGMLNNFKARRDTEISTPFVSASRAELQKWLSLEELFTTPDLEEKVLKCVVTLSMCHEDTANGQVTAYLNGDE